MTITLTWDSSGLAEDFDHYLVSRRRSETGPWDKIAELRNETTTSFADVEHRWSVEEHYRVQVVNTDGEISLPSNISTSKPKTQPGWSIGSNHADTSVDADVLTGISIDMPTDRQLHVPHGRDYHLSTSTGRRRGLHTSFDVLVHDRPGLAKYDSWLDLVDADVPYWSLADLHGDRRLVTLILAGSSETIDTHGRMTIEAHEVAGKPTHVVLE